MIIRQINKLQCLYITLNNLHHPTQTLQLVISQIQYPNPINLLYQQQPYILDKTLRLVDSNSLEILKILNY